MVSARFNAIFLCGLLLAKLANAADTFLQKQSGSLLSDLEAVFGNNSLQPIIAKLEVHLESMFRSLPRNSQNRLGHATARYALHRINADLHGWTVSGLEPNATTFNTTALVGSGVLSGLLPAYVEDIFAAHTEASGFSLDDIAIFASTIEHLVHEDQKDILRKACEVLDLPTMGHMKEEEMIMIIQLYMATFLQSLNTSRLTGKMANRLLSKMSQVYPGWEDTTMLIDDERDTLLHKDKDWANPFRPRTSTLQVALRVVEQIADHFVRKQAEPECQEIKEDLLEFERGDTGRLRLADFYRAGLGSRFFFTETKEYLRALGVLDESDLLVGPKVIVPNYVLSKTNCLAHTHIYSICCINECEGLFGHLEHGLAAPEGAPDQIASLVATLSSSTVQAPRNLSQTLLRRLDEIAAAHGGNVLLHGRLFAQWMHQAFPRECPYPHPVGTTTSLAPGAWGKHTQQNYSIDKGVPSGEVRNATLGYIDTIEASLDPLDVAELVDGGADAMWTSEEEHFVEPTRSLIARVGAMSRAFGGCFVVLLPVLFAAIAIMMKASLASGTGRKVEQYLV